MTRLQPCTLTKTHLILYIILLYQNYIHFPISSPIIFLIISQIFQIEFQVFIFDFINKFEYSNLLLLNSFYNNHIFNLQLILKIKYFIWNHLMYLLYFLNLRCSSQACLFSLNFCRLIRFFFLNLMSFYELFCLFFSLFFMRFVLYRFSRDLRRIIKFLRFFLCLCLSFDCLWMGLIF